MQHPACAARRHAERLRPERLTRPERHTVPDRVSVRTPTAVGAVLTAVAALVIAVVAALLASPGVVGPRPAVADRPAAVSTAADVHSRATAPHADDGSETADAVRAAPRHEPHHELPQPRIHLAPCTRDAVVHLHGTAPSAAPDERTPASTPHAPHGRVRAPPTSSGT